MKSYVLDIVKNKQSIMRRFLLANLGFEPEILGDSHW
jgi:hypothetical protein